MSNALPVALLRPSWVFCSSTAPVSQRTVLAAFPRRFYSQALNVKPSLLPLLQSRRSLAFNRSFSSTSPPYAKVSGTSEIPTPPRQPHPQRKRTVKIGPLPNGRVDDGTIRRLFGNRLSSNDGNNVLRILQHRRTSGSLADYGVDNLGKQYANVGRELAVKGLEWLRDQYPIDEAQAAEEWAEKEANRISYELWLADPENESKYKDPARAFREQQQKEMDEQREREQQEERRIGMLRIGPSEFDRNIEEKRRKRLEDVTKKAEEKEAKEKEMEEKLASGEWVRTPGGTQLMKPGQTAYVDIFGREQISRSKEMHEYYQKKAVTPFKDEEDMLSKTTLSQRLYPMSAFVLVICLISFGFAHYYTPPSTDYRLWPDLSPTTATIAAIIASNVFVCIAWRWRPLWPILTKYFMHVPGYPKAVQAVLNVFSHVQYEHLLANMMMLCLVGPVCHDLVGRGTFLGTYFSAGAVGTLLSLYWANVGRGNITAHSVGASAAIWGISALYCLLTEQDSIKIPVVKDLEVNFWPKTLFIAFVLLEIRTALKRGAGSMDHASHFGGMLVGMGAAGYLRATGFHQRRVTDPAENVQMKAKMNQETVDVGAIVKDEVKEIKECIKKIGK